MARLRFHWGSSAHSTVSVTFRRLTAVQYPGSLKSLGLTGLPRVWPLLNPRKQGNLPRPVWDSRSTQVVVWSDTPRGQVHRWWSPEARTDCRTQPPCPQFPAGGVQWGSGTLPAAGGEQPHQWALSQELWLARQVTAWRWEGISSGVTVLP